MIGDVYNKYVLDLGCGCGEFTKKVALKRAFTVGIDGSEKMISYASKENAGSAAMYAIMDITKPLPIKSRSMDIVIANMVLMDIPDIEICISEVARVLRIDGIFLLSITHPAFFCSDWAHEDTNPRGYKVVRDYLHEKCEPVSFWGETLHYHRPLSSYFNAFEKSGMCVLSLKEPFQILRRILRTHHFSLILGFHHLLY
ncbi:MAG TPA: class I SAM-dependent methyltransferase [Methanospirillum sp.]|uniref:class I SAM-dependent methyltransferase n=1 Tax=Methanospirillum sp. TaxID=45200 RepID=UPI002C648156|nr:class I SAM-dependent methyltransferase [Methanospirillum sp.]HWQ64145.1 class I SAM-dependent methyltransferase [Methanospirillum sp.]